MSTDERTWPTEADDAWADRFELTALLHTPARRADVDAWLDEVQRAVTDSGQSAAELFGDADDAAREHAAEIPAERAAATDLGGATPADLPEHALIFAGLFMTAMGVALVVQDGWTFTLEPDHVLRTLAIALGGVAAAATGLLWRSGRTRDAVVPIPLAIGLVVAVLGVAKVAGLDLDRSLTTLPTLLVPALGLALLVVAWCLPSADPDLDARSRDWPAERWFARLDGLLRGRYKVPRAQARAMTDEARAHVSLHGGHPFDSFGAPETYAYELADVDPRRDRFRGRSERLTSAFFGSLMTVYVVASFAGDDVDWVTWLALLGAALSWAGALWPRRPGA